MKINTPQTLAAACTLALVVSTLSGSAFARGSSGGRSSSGMGRSGTRMMGRNTGRMTSTNGVHPINNFKTNGARISRGRGINNRMTNRFVANRQRVQRSRTRAFAGHKGVYWKNYLGWGKPRGRFGWGWGSWYSPDCDGWCSYEPLPVVAYYNPYCECGGNIVDGVDYSVPIASTDAAPAEADDTDAFAAAREAFAQGDLNGALRAISAAVLQTPHNPDVHQFHSLLLFAAGSYCKSATVAHAVLEEGPGWNWDTLQTLYPSPEIYTQQLRRLEGFVGQHPSDPNVRFLLGYHYLMLNHVDSAQRQLTQVVEMQPKDRLAVNILAGMKNEMPINSSPAATDSKNAVPIRTVPMRKIPIRNLQPKVATDQPAPTDTDYEEAAPVKDAVANTAPVNISPLRLTPLKPIIDKAAPAENLSTDPSLLETSPVSTSSGETSSTDTSAVETTAAKIGPDKVVPTQTPPTEPVSEEEEEAAAKTQKDELAKTQVVKKATAKILPATVSTEKPSVDDVEEESTDPTPPVNEELVAETHVSKPATTPLTGTWKASPEKGIQIELTLRADKTFTWKFKANGKTQAFAGKYVLSAKSLVLTREDGDSMDGTFVRNGEDAFKFRMKDAESDDPGLNFAR
ncbi:MAG TPA: hypothetical protein VGP63_04875 [Planctomycetaceae bacterium]|nr:hypothetical protein [Planctomycetaceae bacterium]